MADQALTEVKALVGAYLERQHVPHRWALFHWRMAATLPAWRVLARAGHRRLARRYAAHAWALDQQAAERCGLAER